MVNEVGSSVEYKFVLYNYDFTDEDDVDKDVDIKLKVSVGEGADNARVLEILRRVVEKAEARFSG